MARRYLQLTPGEWLNLSWAHQQTYLEGFYTEGLLERPEAPLNADMDVPDDVRSLTAEGTGYRTVEAPVMDLDAFIGDMEQRRLPTRKGRWAAVSFDAGSIQSRLELDRSEFTRGLDQAKADADKFAGKPITVKVKADGTEAKKTLDDLTARADKLSGKAASIKVKADTAQANADLNKTGWAAGQLGAKTETITVKADTAQADADLDKTALKADALGRKTETIKVKTDTDTSGIDNLGKAVSDVKDKFSLMGVALSAGIPMLTAAVPETVAAVGLIGASFVGAGAGAIGFGLVASQVMTQAGTDATKLAGLQTKLADATTAKQKTALEQQITNMEKGWTGAYKKLVGDTGIFITDWKKETQALAVPALIPWVEGATKALQILLPALQPVADVFKTWGEDVNKYLGSSKGSDEVKRLATEFGRFSASQLKDVGSFIGDIARGVAALGRDLAGSGVNFGSFGDHLKAWGAGFDSWAHSAGARKDVQGFLAFIHDNAGTLKSIASELGALLPRIGGGLTATGVVELKVLQGFLGVLAALPPRVATTLTEIAAALLIMKNLGVLKVGVKLVGAAVNLLSGGTLALSGTTAAAAMRAAFATGGAAAAAEIRAAMVSGGGVAAAEEGAAGATLGEGAVAAEVAGAGGIGAAIGAAAGIGILAALTAWDLSKDLPPAAKELGATGTTPGGTTPRTDTGLNDPQPPSKNKLTAAGDKLYAAPTFDLQGKNADALNAYTAAVKKSGAASADATAKKAALIKLEASEGTMTQPQATAAVNDYTKKLVASLPATQQAAANHKATAAAASIASVSTRGFANEAKFLGVTLDAGKPARAQLVANMVTTGSSAKAAGPLVDALSKNVTLVGTAADRASGARKNMISDLVAVGVKSPQAIKDTDALATAIALHGKTGTAYQGARQKLLTDLEKQGIDAGTAAAIVDSQLIPSMHKFGDSISGSNQGRKNMISDLVAMGLNAGTAKTDTNNLADAVKNQGVKAAEHSSQRQQLISDLVASGMSAQDAAAYVDGLIGKLGQVKSPPPVNIDVTTTFKQVGSPTAPGNAAAVAQQKITSALTQGGAFGGLVTSGGILRLAAGGTVGTDTVPAMLTPGERVLSLAQVAAMGGHTAISHLAAGGAASGVVTGSPSMPAAAGVGGDKLKTQATKDAKDVADVWSRSGAKWYDTAKGAFKKQVTDPLTAAVTTTIPATFNRTVPTWYSTHAATLKSQVTTPLVTLVNTTVPGAFNKTVPTWYSTHADTLNSQVIAPTRAYVTSTLPGYFTSTIPHWFTAAAPTHAAQVQAPLDTYYRQTLPATITTGFTGAMTQVGAVANKDIGALNAVTRVGGISPVGSLSFARGGVMPGYEPGRDTMSIMVGGGEGILVPEAVRGIGGAPAINALNRRFAGHRGAGYANGGVAGSSVASYAAGVKNTYTWGGAAPPFTDCSGLTAAVYEHFGLIPAKPGTRWGTAASQYTSPLLISAGEQPGAMVFFAGSDGTNTVPGHVGISLGGGKYVGADGPQGAQNAIDSESGNVGFRVPKQGWIPGGILGQLVAAMVKTEMFGNAVATKAGGQANLIAAGAKPVAGALVNASGYGYARGGTVPDALNEMALHQIRAVTESNVTAKVKAEAAALAALAAGGDSGVAGSGAVGALIANAATIGAYLQAAGLSKIATAGIMGNMLQESGGNPLIGGGGLIQITGAHPSSLAESLAQTIAYIQANGGIGLLNQAGDVATATRVFMDSYERPAVATENYANRLAGANAAYAAGYDSGGWLQPGTTLARNDTGRPELVISGDQLDALSKNGPGGRAGGQLAGTINIMLPEGGTVADAFSELTFRLRAAQQQSWTGGNPYG